MGGLSEVGVQRRGRSRGPAPHLPCPRLASHQESVLPITTLRHTRIPTQNPPHTPQPPHPSHTQCHGTATLLRRPGMLLVRTLAVANSSDALYGCVFCGGYALPELSMGGGGNDESTAVKVYENLRQALVNRYPLPHRMPVLAGTVPCKTCHGSGKVARLTPVTGRALGLERAWSRGITSRLGRRYLFKENRPADRQRLFMEYPGEPQPDAHSMPDVVEKPPIVYPPGVGFGDCCFVWGGSEGKVGGPDVGERGANVGEGGS